MTIFFGVLLVFGLVLVGLIVRQRKRRNPGVVFASPDLPLVGCSLAFQKDPAHFLRHTRRLLGPIFGLDLAGFQLILLSDPCAIQHYYQQPEHILSSYAQLTSIGFDIALGHENVVEAPPKMRRWLRLMSVDGFLARFSAFLNERVTRFAREQDDFFDLVRTLFVGATCSALLAGFDDDEFVREFMRWQNDYEEAIQRRHARLWPANNSTNARSLPVATVAPRWVASGVLRPLATRRRALASRLAPVVRQRRRSGARSDDLLQQVLESDAARSDIDVGDTLVGLLTAAPKNAGLAFANLQLRMVGDAALRHAFATAPDAVLDAELRAGNLSIGSVRRAMAPLLLRTANGGTLALRVGDVVAVSHLLAGDAAAAAAQPAPDGLLHDIETYAFSGGVHRCPGAALARAMVLAACQVFDRAVSLQLHAPLPPLCHRKATLAQRAGKVAVTLAT